MMAQPASFARFVRRTQLSAHEYHKNFLKLDEGIIAAVTSAEADRVTPLMSKIYLRLVNAPARFREREGVLRFEAEHREAGQVKAWAVLCEALGVAGATASKALAWLHGQGIIGYFAGKNGAGIRVFLNRASASIGVRAPAPGQKILCFPPGSSRGSHGSRNEPASKDSYAVPEGLDTGINPRAPKNGADTTTVGEINSEPKPGHDGPPPLARHPGREVEHPSVPTGAITADEVVARLTRELGPCVESAAARAASQAAAREAAQTRRWFEERALPKAVRVAQRETYDLFRKLGTLDERRGLARANLQVGRAADEPAPAAVPLSPGEITEVAETCVALFEAQGRGIEMTLSEISAGNGGCVLPEDVPKVRAEAERLLRVSARGR